MIKQTVAAVGAALLMLADFKGCAPEGSGKITFTNEPYDADTRCEGRVVNVKDLPDGTRKLWYLDTDCKKRETVILSVPEVQNSACGGKWKGQNMFYPDCATVDINPNQ